VTACSVIANESTSPLPNIHAEFYENIVVIRTKANSVLDPSKLFILFLLILLVVYAVLYYFRRRHCIVCQKKLIFNMERCYMCIFVGAYPPDPVLVKALEEKGEQIQDEPPPRFLGSKMFVATVRFLWALMCLKCDTLGTYCCSGGRRPKIVPATPDVEAKHADYDGTIELYDNSNGGGGKKDKSNKKKKSKKTVRLSVDATAAAPESNANDNAAHIPKGGVSGRTTPDPPSWRDPSIQSPRRSSKHISNWFKSSLHPHKNPNKLPYPDHIIYAAIEHHDYRHPPDPGPKNIPESAPGFKQATTINNTVSGASAGMRY
jgi:hypothetical protein